MSAKLQKTAQYMDYAVSIHQLFIFCFCLQIQIGVQPARPGILSGVCWLSFLSQIQLKNMVFFPGFPFLIFQAW